MEKIAIIGLSCLFPGAHTPDEYWQNLLDGKDSTSTATRQQMGVDPALLYHPDKGHQDKFYAMRGGYIRDFAFDAGEYDDPAFIASLDRLYQWSLYVARQALEDSGYLGRGDALARAGVIMGNLSFPTRASSQLIDPLYSQTVEAALQSLAQSERLQLPHLQSESELSLYNASISGYPAALVAQIFSLGAIHFCLDAACASSLYAVKLACDYLAAGKADLMLAGAVSCADPCNINMGFSIFHAYPEKGTESRPLNRASNGLTAAEGAGMFVLKRHSDALRDGDKIYATILGCGLSNDGRGKHLLTPNSAGQIIAFERAYAEAGIAPQQIEYVECHATGTPLGDITELNSMETFFGRHQTAPKIGSSKSNLGHLLTAAGMASMTKMILSMAHNLIPATINVTDPLSSAKGEVMAAGQVVNRAQPWNTANKQAAISAFGFGGTNAHLVLEHHHQPAADATPVTSPAAMPRLAIVGMDAFFGPCSTLDAFERSIFDGTQHFIPLPESRWLGIEDRPELLRAWGLEQGAPDGAYIEQFEIDFLQFKIPPIAADQPIPQQLLMLKVADNALRDASMKEGGNVAVIIAMGAELGLHSFRGRVDLSWQIREGLERAGVTLAPDELSALEAIAKESVHNWPQVNQYVSFIGNIIASRIAALWDFSGPAFTLSADENSSFKALEVAQLMLAAGEVDAVVVGAVDLAGGVENVLLHARMAPLETGAPGLSHDHQSGGWLVGEGAGAVVLKRHDRADEDGDRVYAAIDSIGMVQGSGPAPQPPSAGAVAQACQQAFDVVEIAAEDVGYLELYASGYPREDAAEIEGLAQVYRNSGLHCAVGSVKANVGHTYAAAGLASLIKTALCLHRQTIPATPAWTQPARPERWQSGPFYVPTNSRPWVLEQGASRRVAAINGLGLDGTHTHLLLSEADRPVSAPGPGSVNLHYHLFPLAANSWAEMAEQLQALRQTIEKASSLPLAAAETFQTFQAATQATYALLIVGDSKAVLLKEIDLALKGIDTAFERGGAWRTPLGSAFTANPLGKKGEVAFVYPGSFTAYAGLGRGLFRAVDGLYDRFARMTSDMRRSLAEDHLYPRSREALSPPQKEALKAGLRDDSIAMFESETSFAALFTMVMRDYFKLQPKAVVGYSMGEASMLLAMGVWRDIDQGSHLLHTSELFRTQLTGPKEAVADLLTNSDGSRDEWGSYILFSPVEPVRAAIAGQPRIFLTQINTANEVMISGSSTDCQQVIESLGCEHIRSPFSEVIHCEPVRKVYNAVRDLHTLPAYLVPGVDFYSSSTYNKIAVDSQSAARAIADEFCAVVDFPRLVEQLYQDGGRIFVELGPRSTCTRWIDTILKDREHLAVPINQSRVPDELSLVRLLAQLVSQRVPLDLSPLYKLLQSTRRKALVKTVKLGGNRIADYILTPEHRAQFAYLAERFAAQTVPTPPPLEEVSVTRPAAKTNGHLGPPTPPDKITPLPPLPEVDHNLARRDYPAFLQSRRESLRELGQAIQTQMQGWEQSPASGSVPVARAAPVGVATEAVAAAEMPATPPLDYPVGQSTVPAIWDEADLLEFAVGDIAPVFGEEYAIIDSYHRRVRLPMPPYLLVSRVTRLNATPGDFTNPSTITTEYDIPLDGWYSVDGQIPWAVSVESGQCDLLLISYLGIDFECRGERVYRLLNCTLTFLDDLPKNGDTLRYDISINSFARSGDNLLFFFSYECFVGDKMVLKMHDGCAGFFSDGELDAGRGIILTADEIRAREAVQKQHFAPLLHCHKTTFDYDDLLHLCRGDVAACLGEQYDQNGLNPSLRLPPRAMLMLDRITQIDPVGGPWGLGTMVAEQDLTPEHWFFPCHFKDDQVMAGSLMAEGCGQLLQFYMLYLGLQTHTEDARFQPIPDLPQVVRCRGQVTPMHGKLIYRMEITEIGLSPQPYAKANVDIVLNGKVIVDFKDLGLQLTEKTPPPAGIGPVTVKKPALFDERQIAEFAQGSIVAAFGPDYDQYEHKRAQRIPNGDLNLIDRVPAVEATRMDFTPGASLVSEYDVPIDPWYLRDNAHPTIPYSVLMEIALQPCGFLSFYLGSGMLFPDEDMYFRNLDGQATLLKQIDLRGKTITNRVKLLSSTSIQGMIIQKFAFELSCDGDVFYQGDTAFGYFSYQTMMNQVGLDSGQRVLPWYQQQRGLLPLEFDLTDPATRRRLYNASPGKPHYHLAGRHLDLIDRALVVASAQGNGYVYASKAVDPADWFFDCHFYQDPVMPGSLGIEAIYQAMQVYALAFDLGKQFESPYFEQVLDHQIIWKYRGQILRTNPQMQLEVQITRVDVQPDQVLIVGDASLWKEDLRIYEVKQIAIRILNADTH